MNAKQAKALRAELLPSPRGEVGVSRGHIFRELAEHQEDGTLVKEYPWILQELYGPIRVQLPMRIINKPDTPRGIYRQLKKRIKNAK